MSRGNMPSWLHNGLRGRAKFCEKSMDSVMQSATATEEAKALAADIQQQSRLLYAALEIRIDP